ncbi:hypothetical protein K3495_g6688 [Podosphaera aphanis]|nr:hypothetical protein K3495_g6688 [Podosphaera aphanis]
MFPLRRVCIGVILITAVYFGFSALRKHFEPKTIKPDEKSEDKRWVATSPNWLDRQACQWISLCGLAHWRPDPAARRWTKRRLEIQESGKSKDQEGSNSENLDVHVWEKYSFSAEQVELGNEEGEPRNLQSIPQYVIDYAPLIHLYSGEKFWPSDIGEHLMHTTPYLNHTSLNLSNHRYTPYNLHLLNKEYESRQLYMHSKDDVEGRPEWLGSDYNKPTPYDDDDDGVDDNFDDLAERRADHLNRIDEEGEGEKSWYDASPIAQKSIVTVLKDPSLNTTGKTELRRHKKRSSQDSRNPANSPKVGGYSNAPSILIVVKKGPDILDAFWFFFYSYNLGTTVLGIRYGNHIGDWEHALIRFHKGVPKAVFCSAHSGGLAYAWKAVEKGRGKNRSGRPVLYSAVGSHALYATPGRHPYVLPFGMLADVTDRGPLWDPALNYLAYHHNTSITHDSDAQFYSNKTYSSSKPHGNNSVPDEHIRTSFEPAAENPSAPTSWWWFAGRWGDKFYELRDWRQWRFFGQYHYVNGPLGPRFKNLGRAKVCQSGTTCRIVENLSEKRSWIGMVQ